MKTKDEKPLPECIEGPEASQRFNEGVRQILSVPHSTLVRRERAYKKKSMANPNAGDRSRRSIPRLRAALPSPRSSSISLYRSCR
jgi:hypothetical protein